MVKVIAVTATCLALGSACAATPAVTPVATSTAAAPAVLAVEKPVDDRIDFRLNRTDIDCSGASLSLLPETKVLSAHYVVDGRLGAKCFGRTNAVLVEAWKVMAAVIPPEQLRELGVFVGYTNTSPIDARESIVGVASSTGWTAPGAQVSVDIDFAFVDEVNLTRILVHEMGHVIDGSTGQTAPIVYESECQTFLYRGSCYYADALFLEWVAVFWGNGLFEQVDERGDPSSDVGRARCQANPGFWNSYSASSPTEDFAESYASFVLQIEPKNSEQQAKNEWFARRPELLAAQTQAAEAGYGPYRWPGERCQ